MAKHLRKKCSVCGKPATEIHDPFCSGRCADEDLRKWLGGEYAVPGEEVVDEPL